MTVKQCEETLWFDMGGMLSDLDGEIGPAPKVTAVARGTAPVAYVVIFDGGLAPGQPDGGRAFEVSSAGKISAIDRGCRDIPAGFARRYTDFLLPPK
jgi:hypothetical protein